MVILSTVPPRARANEDRSMSMNSRISDLAHLTEGIARNAQLKPRLRDALIEMMEEANRSAEEGRVAAATASIIGALALIMAHSPSMK
jgi:hypothetical protein